MKMKQKRKAIKRTLVFTGLFLAALNCMHAQDVPQPDFANVPAYYIEGTNELHNLAKENITYATKLKKVVYELQGTASKVRIKQTSNYNFIVKSFEGVDPSAIIQLKTVTVTKKNRQATMGQAQGYTKASLSVDAIPYNLRKLNNNVYQIVPESPLEPGEYIFEAIGIVYSFGIE